MDWQNGRPSPKPIKLIHVRTFFQTPSVKQCPLWQWKMDLSGDGLDDLIVPLPDGYRIYIQTAPGVFGKTATLESDLPPTAQREVGVSAYADAPDISPSLLPTSNPHKSATDPSVTWTNSRDGGYRT